MSETMKPCAECGMPVEQGEYHPYAACLMFKQTHNSATVRANLWSVKDDIDNRWRSVAEQAEKALESSRILIDAHIEDSQNPGSGVVWLVKAKRLMNQALAAFDSLRKEGKDGELP